MIKFSKGDVQYYYNTPKIVIKLEVLRDYEGEHGIGVGFEIKKFIVGSPSKFPFGREIVPGAHISANQLQGVGISGIYDYIFDERGLIKKILK